MITVPSTINLSSQTVPQIIPVVQGDTGRTIQFTIADFTIPTGSTARYYIQKPSGNAVYNNATIEDNNVVVNLTAQAIAETGDNYGQVRIEKDGEIVTSFDFILLVKAFRGIGAVESETEMNIFDQAVEQAEAEITEAKEEALAEIAETGSGNIAVPFDAADSYLAGEYVIYNAKFYKFTSAHTGQWTGSDVEELTVGDALTDLEEETTSLKEDLSFSANLFDYFAPVWERKGVGIGGSDKIGTTNYCWESSTKRISFKPYLNIYSASSVVCTVASGYKYILMGFNDDVSERVYNSDWTTSGTAHDIQEAVNIIVVLAKTDDSDITIDDSTNIQIDINLNPRALTDLVDKVNLNADKIETIKTNESLPVYIGADSKYWGRYVIGTGGPNRIGTTIKSFDSSTTRISLYPIVNVHDLGTIAVTPQSGYKFYLFGFNQAVSAVTLDSGWKTNAETIDLSNVYYISICLATVSNGTIDVDSYDKLSIATSRTLKDVVIKQEEEIDNVKKLIKTELPQYWAEYFETKQAELTEADMALGFNGVSFVFVTDTHINSNNKISPDIIRHILKSTNLNMAVFGGDAVTDYSTKQNAVAELQWWCENTKDLHMINMHGNHDGNSNNQTDQTQIISDAEFYGLMCRQSEGIVNWENGTLYGYKDNENQKVRFIFLDTGAPDSAVIGASQITWMQNKISELENGWTVVVFCHQFWTGASKTTQSLTIDANGTAIMNALDAIYDAVSAKIACVVAGHCHRNYSMVSAKGYPIIATTCDSAGTNASVYDPDTPTRTEGTTDEQAFDLFYINTNAKTISVVRIGAGDTTQNRNFTF